MAFSWYGLLCSLIVINVLLETGVSGSSGKSNPLEADDILRKYTFSNYRQCQNMCWYIKLCGRWSFYARNCVLHARGEKDQELADGWRQEQASGSSLYSSHGCRPRPCGKTQLCMRYGWSHFCRNLPADVNECASSPCQNGGNCVDGDRAYTCNCLPGYLGDHCETDIDECASNPCQHGGSCSDQANGYTCTCQPGYTGLHCETDIDECASNPCQHGGSCSDQFDGYTCTCQPGYTGLDCETDIDECASNPCQHGGNCYDQVNGYTCTCQPGYTGLNCDEDIDECASNPCQHGGICSDQVNGYTCACQPGYTGLNCDKDIDECASNPCQHGGICSDQVNGYTCACQPGYTGLNCDKDIDECASNPCQHGGICSDQVNGYTCACQPGYTGLNCDKDIDECFSSPCQHRGICSDQVNGYTCTCQPGYNGPNCEIEIWLEKGCGKNRPCMYEKAGCFSGKCLCKDGLFYSSSQNECVEDCSQLATTYLHYENMDLTGVVSATISPADSIVCAKECYIEPECLTVILFQNICYMKRFTGQGPDGYWQGKIGAQMYQRVCE